LSDKVVRRFYKYWYKSKKKAFSKYSKLYESKEGESSVEAGARQARGLRAIDLHLNHLVVVHLWGLLPIPLASILPQLRYLRERQLLNSPSTLHNGRPH
jgi:hypothetical protein